MILATMLLGALGTVWSLMGLADLAQEGHLSRTNFRGELIPTGMGVSFCLVRVWACWPAFGWVCIRSGT